MSPVRSARPTRLAPLLSLLLSAVLTGCANLPSGTSTSMGGGDGDGSPFTGPQDNANAAGTVPPAARTAAPVPGVPVTAQAGPAQPPVPVDPLRPDRQVVPESAEARADLWQRVRDGFGMPDLDGELVRDREAYYAARPDYVARMTERSNRYLFYILEEVQKRQLPSELALLPFIESAFNPTALSSAKASGIWQFMPATGRHYDLTQNMFRDDRRDVLASTRAALDYLAYLYGMFNDWHLALAAYNWGEGSVQRAIERNRRAGLGTTYLDLRMPAETRYYVPKLQAVKNIIAEPGRFAITLPPIENHPYFLSVPIERDIDVSLAASLAGLDLTEFKALNPQMNRPVILAAGTPQVLLPYDNANRFVREFSRHRGPYASWTAWTAPSTMGVAAAAKEVGMSESELREVNNIPPRMLVRGGSTLLIARSEQIRHDVSEHVAENAMMLLAPEARSAQRRITVKAGAKGSSVAEIARRYRVSAAQVAQWNDVSTAARFRAGQAVVVYLPPSAKATRSAARRSTANAARPAKKSVAAASVRRAQAKSVSRTTAAKAATSNRSAAARKATRSASAAKARTTAKSSTRNNSTRVANTKDESGG